MESLFSNNEKMQNFQIVKILDEIHQKGLRSLG